MNNDRYLIDLNFYPCEIFFLKTTEMNIAFISYISFNLTNNLFSSKQVSINYLYNANACPVKSCVFLSRLNLL